ncbi:MAG: hypothetical protein HY691_09670 [Chloroflexi bacterium]|nr:hypothetical protein [Chloroflexota bacterium]
MFQDARRPAPPRLRRAVSTPARVALGALALLVVGALAGYAVAAGLAVAGRTATVGAADLGLSAGAAAGGAPGAGLLTEYDAPAAQPLAADCSAPLAFRSTQPTRHVLLPLVVKPERPPGPAPATGDRGPVDDPNTIRAGALTLSATFNSIGVELLFAGDANGDASAALEFQRADEATWRLGLPLWRVASSSAPGSAFYGSALMLDAGTSYDVRVTLRDPDGVVGPATLVGTVATRAESIPPAEVVQPTHYVRAEGDDASDGLTPATAWRTLRKGVADAPPGAVVQVGPGYYQAGDVERRQPLTLVAQHPAVDDQRTPANAGRRSVVEYGVVATPAGSGEPNAGVWQRVALVGPTTGRSFTVWRWPESGFGSLRQLGYAATREGLPKRVALWRAAGPALQTPAGWAEMLYTNRTYTYGFYTSGQDIYLRLPGDLDPNALYVTAGKGSAFVVNGPEVRISGFEMRQLDFGVFFAAAASGGVVDRNLITGSLHGVHFRGAEGPPARYGSDHIVQYNLFEDTSLWSDDPGDPAIPWTFVKLAPRLADGTTYPSWRIGGDAESTAVSGRGGAMRVVVRYNTMDGLFNGVGTGENQRFDRYAGMDMDVHDNLIRRLADDALEPEWAVINFRAWRNRIEQTATVLSTGPATYGPLYLFRNEAWRAGAEGVGRDGTGDVGVGATFFKYSGRSTPPARVYVLHNTLWTDARDVSGGAQYAGGGPATEMLYLRNNIIHASRYAFSAPTGSGRWDEDYNAFSTTDRIRGLEYGRRYTTDVPAYRGASGQGAHTNLSGDFVTPPVLADPAAGDLRLPRGSPLVDAGVPVPNVSDRPDIDYRGAAPDLGASER